MFQKTYLVLGFIAVCFFSFILLAQEKKAEEGKQKYMGIKNCSYCHSGEKNGKVYELWDKSKHAEAYKDLSSKKAKEIAKEQEIKDPKKSDKCLICHVTGYGSPKEMFAASFRTKDGVSCEACHGPASEYIRTHHNDKKEQSKEQGFIQKPSEELCVKCHNSDSHAKEEFNFEEAIKKIEHKVSPKEQLNTKFVGVGNCRGCHSSDRIGKQMQIWEASAHAKAYKNLTTDKAKEIIKTSGIKDVKKCLICHSTGFGEPNERFAKSYKAEEGITCEACHGAAGEWLQLHNTNREEAVKKGLIPKPGVDICKKCHNSESPAYKELNFQEAKKKIEHKKAR
ncbi:MAG: multiheme c-type cytochrome [Planctomycetota bacterium]